MATAASRALALESTCARTSSRATSSRTDAGPHHRRSSRIGGVAVIHGFDVDLVRTIALVSLALSSTPALADVGVLRAPASSRPSVFAPTRISAAVLRAEGFDDRAELERAISLRLPGLVLLADGEAAPPAEPGSLRAHIELRRVDDRLALTLILADGRAYLRELEVDAEAPARSAASTLANLVAGVEDATAVPDREDVALPPALVAADTPVPKASPAPVAAPAPAPAPVTPAPAPRWLLGPVLHVGGVLGLAPPDPGPRGVALGLGLDLRAPSGLLLAVDLRWLPRAVDRYHLQRVRVALGVGYVVRRGGFELPIAALFAVEPWWLGARDGPVPLQSRMGGPGPLLGLGLRLAPGFHAPLGARGARLRVGARVELWSSGQASAGLHRPELRITDRPVGLGGPELQLGLELGVWLPAGPDAARRPRTTGP